MSRPGAILIAGPTASGKSALALALAREFDGVVINADSQQVYADLRILTARPTEADEAAAEHRLYGIVPGSEAYSTGRWLRDVGEVLAALGGRMPVIVGGTGLYFKALTEGLSDVPTPSPEVRAFWRTEMDRLGPIALHAELEKRDPEMAARLEPGDRQRIARALEVIETTGRSLAAWHDDGRRSLLDGPDVTKLVIRPPRQWLRDRCDQRFEAMLQAGALTEVERLRSAKLDPTLPIMRALGLRPLLAHLDGQLSRAAAIERAQAETRQYAKRQETWFRHQLDATWQPIEDLSEASIGKALALVATGN